jgi:hypothetical protein
VQAGRLGQAAEAGRVASDPDIRDVDKARAPGVPVDRQLLGEQGLVVDD